MQHSFPPKSPNTWRLLILTSQGPVVTLGKNLQNMGTKNNTQAHKASCHSQDTKNADEPNKKREKSVKKGQIETKDERAGQLFCVRKRGPVGPAKEMAQINK